MPHSSKARTLSYPETVRVFNDGPFAANLKEALQTLAESFTTLLSSFKSLSSQLHSFDLQGFITPLKPKWNALCQDYLDIVSQFRINAGIISGRLRMFWTVVLPLIVRRNESQTEKVQVLQSFMGISSEHARLSWSLAERVLNLTSALTSFHAEFSRFAASRTSSGQQELYDLSSKLGQLQATVKQLYYAVGNLTGVDVTYLAYSTSRFVASFRGRSSTPLVSLNQLAHHGTELSAIASLYQELDRTQNAVAHTHYAVQVVNRGTDIVTTVRTAMSKLVSDEIITVRTGVVLLLSIWSRLQTDCVQLNGWLNDPRQARPLCIGAYQDSGKTLYHPIADALDTFIASLDSQGLGSTVP